MQVCELLFSFLFHSFCFFVSRHARRAQIFEAVAKTLPQHHCMGKSRRSKYGFCARSKTTTQGDEQAIHRREEEKDFELA
jgi:hypothetical protein